MLLTESATKINKNMDLQMRKCRNEQIKQNVKKKDLTCVIVSSAVFL